MPKFCWASARVLRGGDEVEDMGSLWAGPIFLKLILLGEIQQQDKNLLNYINIIVTRKIQ